MSSTAGAMIGLPPADPATQRRGRIALGIAVSLAVHLLLLSAWRGKLFHDRSEEAPAPPRSIAVWLRPPPPQAAPQPEQAAPASKASPAVRPRKPRRVIALPRREQEPGRQVVQQDDAPAQPQPSGQAETPRFDHDAALRTARRIAAEPDPSGAPRKPLQAESKLARAISAAKRRDCKDGLPGGLLGPIIIMFDKKDSGCKW